MLQRVEQRGRGRHWPKAEIRENKLVVEGERYAFVRGLKRRVRLVISKLIHERNIEIDEGRTRRIDRLSGIGTIESDRLAVAGVTAPEVEVQEIFLTIKPAPEEEKKFHWRISFAIIAYESEVGLEDHWSCEAYLPERVFNEIIAAYNAGILDDLRLGCETDMWVRDGIQLLPNLSYDAKVTWFLAPPLDPAEHPEAGRGMIQAFSWSEPVEPNSKRGNKVDKAGGESSAMTRILHVILAVLVAIVAALVAVAALILIK